MKKVLASLTLLLTVWAAGAQEHTSMDNRQADGYRGIWFTIGQAVRPTGPNTRAAWEPTR